MGLSLMNQLPLPADPGRFIVTPHPVLLDGQRNMACDLRPGESLYAFLQRHVDGLDGQAWAVTIGGREVPRHLWHCVYPKHGQVIELRGAVGRSALAIVALVALTYFTFGAGGMAGGSFLGLTGIAGYAAATGAYMAGAMLINKVLTPKVPSASSTAETVYSLSSANNRARPYEPLGLLFGCITITPDLASAPYTWFEGDDQYLGMTLTPGINVDRIGDLYNGDTLLSSYEGVTVWHSGYSGMPEQTIPLYSNADTTDGGTLIDTSTDPKHTAGAWIERTSSADTIRLKVDVEMILYDTTSKGKPKNNTEWVQIQYRPTGSTTWLAWGVYFITNSTQKTRRFSWTKDVEAGQYDVRVRTTGQNTDGKGASCKATWNTLTSIQQDPASYAGIPRTGIKIKATGQLNGALQEVRGKAYAKPLQLWDGSAWNTVTEPGADGISNPGAQILYYARGIRDDDGTLIGGMGLDDDMIDIEALKGFMLYCADNGYTYDYWITDARSHSDVLDKIALNGMGEITWAGGKLSVVWAGADQPLSGVVNMATIKRGTFQVDYALANAADGIEYSYTDPDTLETKTLRVPAPGVTTMLNPAQVAGEGITSEAHAARMARWHLAQSLYQFKSISYDTDLEHLSYRRLSVLALQHDLTQWGYGGRVRAAVNAGGTVTLTLDEPVPAPSNGNAYIGLRIPGEAVYRVFAIQPFTGETTSITLADAWPSDAAVPGDSDGNPAWDTIWIYDFKQTPGYRVRVTGIEPESDLKGASISVVPEGPEFWTYVLTGAYTPAPNQSLLPTRPVASNLRVTERQVITGDVVHTELQVTFDVSGYAAYSVVSCDVDGDDQLDEVAQTVTRSASFRIPGAGSYTILVRPYDKNGNAGVPGTLIYTTAQADEPPVLVDTFTVEAIDGGLRRYTWGFDADTIQSPDFAGVEIRYESGTATAPDWNNMTILGSGDGFFTAAFETSTPAAGTWTFACRSRNTSGTLSDGYRLVTVTLGGNLGETIDGVQTGVDAAQQAAADAVNQAQAMADAARDAAEQYADQAAQAAADAAAQAQSIATIANAKADSLSAQVSEITGAADYDADTDYDAGDYFRYDGGLYRAIQDAPAGTSPTDTAYFEKVGDFASLGDAVAAAVAQSNQNASDIEAESQRLDAVVARMPAGNGSVASSAELLAEQSARASGDAALSGQINAANAAIAGKADASALAALQSTVTSQGNTLSSQGASITSLGNRLTVSEQQGANLVPDGSFEAGSGTLNSRFVLQTSGGRTGKGCIKGLAGEGYGTAALATLSSNPAGRRYRCTMATKVTSAVSAGTLTLQLRSYVGTDAHPTKFPGVVRTLTGAAGDWVVTTGDVTIDADVRRVDIWLVSSAMTAGEFLVDDVSVIDVTEAYAAQQTADAAASATAALQSTVTSQGNTLTSQGSSITSLSNEITTARNGAASLDARLDGIDTTVAGKASADALSALQSTVTSQGNTISSQGSSITSLDNRLTVSERQGMNLIPDGSFEAGGGTVVSRFVRENTNARTGTWNLRCQAGAGYGEFTLSSSAGITNLAGRRLRMSMWTKVVSVTSAGTITCQALCYTGTSPTYLDVYRTLAGVTSTEWFKTEGDIVIPAGVDRVVFRLVASQNMDGEFCVDDVSVIDVTEAYAAQQTADAAAAATSALSTQVTNQGNTLTSQGQQITSLSNTINNSSTGLPSKASAAALSALQSTVTSQGNTLSSQASTLSSLSTTVNGHTSTLSTYGTSINGLQSKWGVTATTNGVVTGISLNSGASSSAFAVQADKFSIVPSSSSGARTEFSNGNWRIYDANGTLRVRMGVW